MPNLKLLERKDLKIGNVYKCALSGNVMIVISKKDRSDGMKIWAEVKCKFYNSVTGCYSFDDVGDYQLYSE